MLPVVVLVLAGFGVYVAVEREQSLVPEIQEQTRAYARAVDIAFEYGIRDLDAERIQAFLNRMSADPRVVGVAVYGTDGTVRYRADSLPAEAMAPDSLVRRLLQGQEEASYEQTVNGRRLYTVLRVIREPSSGGGAVAGAGVRAAAGRRPRRGEAPAGGDDRSGPVLGVLEVAQPYDLLAGNVRRTQLQVATVAVLLLGAVALVISWLLRRIAEAPLQRLVAASRALGEGDVDARVPQAMGAAELTALAREFNLMAARLSGARRELLAESEERVRLERRLAEAEKLAAVGTLAAGLAHEIGAPLNVISGRAEMLLRQHPDDSAMRRHLESIVAQIGRITRTVRSLLDYARRPVRRDEPVALSAVIGSAVEALEAEFARAGVTLSRHESYDAWVRGDPDQLQQVVVNLAMNALQAMDGQAPPRELTIRVDAAKAEQAQTHAEAVVTVTDTGPGLPAALAGRLFTPFATTKASGTGLGLVVARSIAQDHGGTLAGSNREDGERGATFTLRLPLAAAPTVGDA